MIKRDISQAVIEAATQFPVIAILGPRQAGKTTLAQELFKNHRYVSLEEYDQRAYAKDNPRDFLDRNSNDYGIILDEIQRVPEILSYIQSYVDREKKRGYFILTGSQNFLVNQAITQTLAGRVAILTLLPFSNSELSANSLLPSDIKTAIFNGYYPSIHTTTAMPKPAAYRWYKNYIATYVERDVRQIINVSSLSVFQDFIALCAGRVGQLLNLTSLGDDVGMSYNTIKSWISLLEASYIIFLLEPHNDNLRKRIIKSPKLYFYDTGLACSLLGIESADQLATHNMRGPLTECLVISELRKQFFNADRTPKTYFWRDKTGHEVDCIIEINQRTIPIEVKSSRSIASDFFKGITYWNELAKKDPANGYVVYAGDQDQTRSLGNVISWKTVGSIINANSITQK